MTKAEGNMGWSLTAQHTRATVGVAHNVAVIAHIGVEHPCKEQASGSFYRADGYSSHIALAGACIFGKSGADIAHALNREGRATGKAAEDGDFIGFVAFIEAVFDGFRLLGGETGKGRK